MYSYIFVLRNAGLSIYLSIYLYICTYVFIHICLENAGLSIYLSIYLVISWTILSIHLHGLPFVRWCSGMLRYRLQENLTVGISSKNPCSTEADRILL